MATKRKKKVFDKEAMIDIISRNKEIINVYKNLQMDDDYLLLQNSTPVKSNILDKILFNFDKHSDIPLSIPFQYTLSHIASYLLENKVYVNKNSQKIYTDIWSIVLASSGSSKSKSIGIIQDTSNIKSNFSSGIASAAAFIEELRENNWSLYLVDECGQQLKNMETQPHMMEFKEYLLKAYDNAKTLERKTKKGCVIVENPHIVYLGATVDDTFYNIMTLESMLDGFSQRFLYVTAIRDETKDIIDYIDYNENLLKKGLYEEFDKIKNLPIHSEYLLVDDFLDVIQKNLRAMIKKVENIPVSFLRRMYFAIYKYSLIYHFILLKDNNILDEEDISYACRYMLVHMKSLKNVLENMGFGEIQPDIMYVDKAVKALKEKKEKVNIATVTRYLQQYHKTKYKDVVKTRQIVSALLIVE